MTRRATSSPVRMVVIAGALCLLAMVIAFVAQAVLPRLADQAGSGRSAVEVLADVVAGAPTAADGRTYSGQTVSVFDDTVPAVANINPSLLAAIRAAAQDAAEDGIDFTVSSGWRSPALQEHLLDEAIALYGSREEAARWVAHPDKSSHVTGDAIDLGGFDAPYWLSQHGARYGLCQTYGNERWHYELRPEAAVGGCPIPYLDPTFDPRLQ